MGEFRFLILGAAQIAEKFCGAVALLPDCTVCAVASRDLARAEAFARKQGIARAYAGYEEALDAERPDCVYIAVTQNDHFRLTMCCIARGIPVLCEKAMFQTSAEAVEAFAYAKEQKVFVMEAMWSRFLPAVRKAREWVAQGGIGKPKLSQFAIGFVAPKDVGNRFFNPALGGGAAKDLAVYGHAMTTYVLRQEVLGMTAHVAWSESGVDESEFVVLKLPELLAEVTASLVTRLEEKMVIYGETGRICLPSPHFASDCILYRNDGTEEAHFVDTETKNGFVYEVAEAMRCVREGRLESETVPHACTLACTRMYDLIAETRQ